MDKVRVYELAKELNTTSKRLMEKLAEINIIVKNHMSLLEEHELEALYDHIGVIRHKEGKAEEEEKKVSAAPSSPKTEPKAEAKKNKKKDFKSAPRIIRTTEIFLDSKDEDAGKFAAGKEHERTSGRDAGHKRDIVKVTDASSGLRAGFVRDTRPDYLREIKPYVKMPDTKLSGTKDAEKGQQQQKQETPVQKTEQAVVEKPQITQETKQDTQEAKKLPSDKVETAQKPGKTDKAVKDKTTEEYPKNVLHPAPGQVSAGEHVKREIHAKDTSQLDVKTAATPEESRSQKKDRERKIAGEHPTKSDVLRKHGQKAEEKRIQASKPAQKFIDIPKPDPSLVLHKEEAGLQRAEARREYLNREAAKDMKREQKKDIQRGQITEKLKKFKPQSIVLSQKKGLSEVLSEDFILDEFYSDDEMVRARKTAKLKKESKEKQEKAKPTLVSIKLPESITVKDLAEAMKKTSTEVIKKLMSLGVMATINQEIDFDTAAIVADEFGIKAEKEIVVNEEDILFDDSEGDESELVPRPPVVVVMGHVDHGKTSLLDAIRKTNVTESEAGGITQHIGAYMVRINDRDITFLDTPGHEAFTAMRARGAQVTDIAILVIAADDGIMPQTVEAINHAKAAKVAIIVAINKIDKPDANPERVKQQLTEHGLVPEEWGGDVICVPVSAKKGENIDHLLEMVLLTADMLELKANPNKQAKGTVIEAKLDKNRGPIATLLVQRGALNVGDTIVTGTTVGRIRAMIDDKGNNIKQAGPSVPVEILGLPEVPEAGELFYVVTDEKVAKQLVEKRKLKQKEQQMRSDVKVSLDDLFKQINEGKIKELNIIVKADVQGSVEAVKQSLEKLSNDEVKVNIIHGGVGAITESDVTLAEVANAIIIGFNVRPGANVIEMAHNANVDIRLYRIIYEAIEDVQAAMKGMLEPKTREVVIGHAEIRQLFKVSGIGTVGGCYVTDGKIFRNSDVRVVRDGIVIHEGKLASLKRFKDDVREVTQGFECGLSIEKFNDLKEGDIVEAYIMEEVAR